MFSLLAALLVLAAPSAGPAPTVLFRLADPQLAEVSGIAAGIASPGVLYVHNDSGDSARFFALDASSGAALAGYRVPGAQNIDWEDIAVARDASGTPSVWLADIGDNDAQRTEITVYRVAEPQVDRAWRGQRLDSAVPEIWRLRYPSSAAGDAPAGPRDAESLAVSPAGVPYLVTKSLFGRSQVYAAGARPGRGVQTLRLVGTLRFRLTGTATQLGPAGQLAATGADWSGSRFVVRTYSDAYFWMVAGEDLAGALTRPPVRVPLPAQPQGEGICFAGDQVIIASEHVGSAVYALPAPAAAVPAGPARAAPFIPVPPHRAATGRPAGSGAASWWWPAAAVGGGVVALALAAVGRSAHRRSVRRTRA